MNSNLLILDVIKILPENIECFIQAPSLENEAIQGMMLDTETPFFKLINLNEKNKAKFIFQIQDKSVNDYFQNIQIKIKNELLFEGYDGVEFGIISKNVELPEWFIEKHVKTKSCIISDKW